MQVYVKPLRVVCGACDGENLAPTGSSRVKCGHCGAVLQVGPDAEDLDKDQFDMVRSESLLDEHTHRALQESAKDDTEDDLQQALRNSLHETMTPQAGAREELMRAQTNKALARSMRHINCGYKAQEKSKQRLIEDTQQALRNSMTDVVRPLVRTEFAVPDGRENSYPSSVGTAASAEASIADRSSGLGIATSAEATKSSGSGGGGGGIATPLAASSDPTPETQLIAPMREMSIASSVDSRRQFAL